uniref:ATP-dependent RNA helicase DHX37 n=1 Tax=Panagrolaimus sp. ES5 TaxID=591445 RepID=A0AC34F104_9BILA
MPNIPRPSKKRKAPKAAQDEPVKIETTSNENEYSTVGDATELALPSKKKKRKEAAEPLPPPEKRENKKKKERREEVTKAKKKVLSKKKQKALETIKKRKEKKQTLESLFESLQEYQFDAGQGLVSTAHRQDKIKRPEIEIERDPVFPKKIRSVSSSVINAKPQRIQQNYYETDSSGEEEDEAEVEVAVVKEEKPVEKEEEPEIVEIKEVTIAPKVDKEVEENKKQRKERLNKFYKVLECIKGEHIPVLRDPEIEEKRSKLPIFAEEMNIVEAINENAVVIVSSETGSGKTTQIPQFLYESGYTLKGHLIGVTEPRRVAAISMSQRVGVELNDLSKVSYQIRFEGNRTDDTKILFMTDGVLLKELQTDLMLSKYSVIIIDEAHERSMYSDVLIGLLSRICFLRAKKAFPLKLIIMSATLRLADFTQKRLFPSMTPKVIKVEARQFPVQIHFERKTPDDYLEAAYKKVCNVHEKLPDGAILVFLSGQGEVKRLLKLLAQRYPMKGKNVRGHLTKNRDRKKAQKEKLKLSSFSQKASTLLDGKTVASEAVAEDDTKADLDEYGTADCGILDDDFDDSNIHFGGDLPPPPPGLSPLYCLPLYSLLSSAKQQRVFQPPPEGTRLCVIATNVAETSLTIPNIRYVIDSGKEKRRDYDPITGVSQFNIHLISQASAEQRSGRAGRVQAGHAYRLYSSAMFEDFTVFSQPEIMNKPIDQLVLHLKAMNIVKISNFPFPTPPLQDQLEIAEKRLRLMGALSSDGSKDAKVTTLGKTLSMFPLSPPFAKMLAMANQHSLMPYAIYLVSALSVREPMTHILHEKGENTIETQKKMKDVLKQRQKWCGIGQSRRLGDLTVLLKALGAADFGQMNPKQCEDLGLRYKAVIEIRKMRRQLVNLINTSCNLKQEITIDTKLEPPTDEQARLLRQILIACLPNQIAKRVDQSESGEVVPKGAYQCQLLEEYCFIDASSMLYQDQPDFVVYQEIVQFNNKKCLQNLSMVDPEWLTQLAEPYCNFVMPDPEKDIPTFDQSSGQVVQNASVTFGERRWPLKAVKRQMPINILHYKHFARLFLGGHVCLKLAGNVPKMLAPPETMIKPWANLQKRTEKLLNALIAEEILSREKLHENWAKKDDYLLEEYLEWLPSSMHDKIQLKWPPM